MNLEQPDLPAPKKHSWLGIASFALALLFIFMVLLGIVILQFNNSGAPTSALQTTVNQIVFVCIMLLNPASVVLGIIALFHKDTKKIFAILGISISLLVGCGLVVLVALGIIYMSSM
jgi:hypothetical protein